MIHDGLTLYRKAADIRADVRKLAARVNADYRGRRTVVMGVLKGACLFFADLVRELDFPVECEFIHVASYGAGTRPAGIELRADPADITGRNILLVEDIVDTGRTARFLSNHLRSLGAGDIDICAFLDKPSRREVDVIVAYAGLSVPDRFFVGYGMDLDGRYRNLPDICIVEGDHS